MATRRYKVIQSSRLYQQIVEQIEQSVVRGEWKPGEQWPAERELAQQFGVSRTAVREAAKAYLRQVRDDSRTTGQQEP